MYGERVHRLSRQGAVVGSMLTVAAAVAAWTLGTRAGQPDVHAAFWFDDVAFSAAELGGALPHEDIATIQQIADGEVRRAFSRLPVRFSSSREARYHVRVVQDVRDARFRREVRVAGQSRGMTGFGGQGSVSFSFMAGGAVAYAPDGANRASIIDAIGRGIGRAAVHEFAHQFLPHAPLHASRDRASYEFHSAARPQQFFGEMHWDLAWPILEARLGRQRDLTGGLGRQTPLN